MWKYAPSLVPLHYAFPEFVNINMKLYHMSRCISVGTAIGLGAAQCGVESC